MDKNVFVDTRLIQDGTARWLWMLRDDNAVFGAGIAMSLTDAEEAGQQALEVIQARHAARKLFRPLPDRQERTLNLDELDRPEEG